MAAAGMHAVGVNTDLDTTTLPATPTALVVNALIAGSAATGVFRLLQGRMLGRQGSAARDDKGPAKRQLSVVPESRSAVA